MCGVCPLLQPTPFVDADDNGFRHAMGYQHNALTPIRRTVDDTRQVLAQIGQGHLHFTHCFTPLFFHCITSIYISYILGLIIRDSLTPHGQSAVHDEPAVKYDGWEQYAATESKRAESDPALLRTQVPTQPRSWPCLSDFDTQSYSTPTTAPGSRERSVRLRCRTRLTVPERSPVVIPVPRPCD